MKIDDLTEIARKRFFKGPDNDFGAKLAQETLIIGLARLLFLQEYLGYDPDATMICFPGTTPTGGTDRLQRGYSLGAVLRYNYSTINVKKEPLIILDAKANCCGVLIARANNKLPTRNELKDIVIRLVRKNPKVEGVEIKVEKYFVGNHFINTYHEDLFTNEGGNWIAIHGSGEMRRDSSLGMGIYVDESEQLQKITRHYNTPLGPIYYLLGKEAMAFMVQYKKAEGLSAKSREFLAKEIFSNIEILCNFSHLTINGPGNYFCGVYNIVPGQVYPFLVNRNDGIVLLQARKNFSSGAIEALGWTKQAVKADTQVILRSINGLPHGGGKIYGQNRYKLIGVNLRDGRILYTISDENREFIVDNLKSLGPITYKGLDELNYIGDLGLADEVGRLQFGRNGYSLNAANWSR